MDFNLYSALVIIGGDGTVQEAVNGMLVRSDGQKLPVGIVPNGYSNDMARALGISSLEKALDTLCRKESVAMDSVKVLIDCDSDYYLPAGPERLANCRHMFTSSTLSMQAKIQDSAKGSVGVFGNFGYSMASFFKGISFGF
jgi:diacylglycerol kinase family enzyme